VTYVAISKRLLHFSGKCAQIVGVEKIYNHRVVTTLRVSNCIQRHKGDVVVLSEQGMQKLVGRYKRRPVSTQAVG